MYLPYLFLLSTTLFLPTSSIPSAYFLMVEKSILFISSQVDMAKTMPILFTLKASQSGTSQTPFIISTRPAHCAVLGPVSVKGLLHHLRVLGHIEKNSGRGEIDKGSGQPCSPQGELFWAVIRVTVCWAHKRRLTFISSWAF